ncbi:MAG: tRNA lysidine(34) synthetase TilS, partial [candidate division WOR-3 bacterium]
MDKLSVVHRFIDTIEEYQLLERGGHVLAGISGGADSVCLLDLLRLIAPRYKLRISGIHINHGIRVNADQDEMFVRNLTQQWDIRLVVVKVDTPSFARKHRMSLETAARRLRYLHYQRTAKRLACNRVALGHTADDNLETVIHNLARGAGLRGLCGIPVHRDIFIRPLIKITRKEIRSYLEARSLKWVEDETNTDVRYTRNLIRLQIIPVMEKINPAVRENVLRTGELLRSEDCFLEDLAQKALSRIGKSNSKRVLIDIKRFNSYNVVLKRRIIRLIAPEITSNHVERIVDLITRKCVGTHCIQAGVVVRIRNAAVEITRKIPKSVN